MPDFTLSAVQSCSVSVDAEDAVHEVKKQDFEVIKRMSDAKQNLAPIIQSIIKESAIPLQVLYNRKVERIRVMEYDKSLAPAPIKFDISDSYTGVKSKKLIQILSDNAPKPYVFEVDLADDENNPRSYET